MYCPICFNDSLKIASAGVVRMTFNKKARNTSQLFYNLQTEKDIEILAKFKAVIEDYFSWYCNFTNKDPIKEVQTYSADFKCTTNNCRLMVDNQLSVVGLLISKKELLQLLKEVSEKYEILLAPNIKIS